MSICREHECIYGLCLASQMDRMVEILIDHSAYKSVAKCVITLETKGNVNVFRFKDACWIFLLHQRRSTNSWQIINGNVM